MDSDKVVLIDKATLAEYPMQQMSFLCRALMRHFQLDRKCTNCDHFNTGDEVCMLPRPPARPPARVIANGCPAWEEEIPF